MNYLKKFGAVALAAVMAVTFAPVASLNAFAGTSFGSSSALDITEINAAAVKTNGSTYFKVSGTTFGSITISGSGVNVTLDLNGKNSENGEITVTAGAVALITNSATGRGATIPTLSAIKVGKESKATIGSGVAVKQHARTGASLAVPSAYVGNDYEYFGNDTINTAYKYVETTANAIEARHGDVKIDGLGNGSTAYVGNDADDGTTITATAESGKTLKKYVTTYTFSYVAGKDWEDYKKGSRVASRATYTDTRWAAGIGTEAKLTTSNAMLDGSGKDEDELVGNGSIFTPGGIAYQLVANNSNSDAKDVHILTSGGVEFSDSPLLGYTGITYTFSTDKTKGYVLPANAANTYYTWDITDLTGDDEALAVVDGDKYVKTADDKGLSTNYVAPEKSYKLVKSSTYTKEDGNKNAKVDIKYYNEDVTLEAPEDVTVASETDTNISGNQVNTKSSATFFGTGKKEGLPKTKIKSSIAGVKLYVQQVSSKADTVTFDAPDKNTTIDRANGIGYYQDNVGKLTFGTAEKVTKAFEDAAQGKVNKGITANPDFRDGNVFASKEIKTTVKGVNADVTFHGEISAEAVATDAKTGKKTWEINLADTATNDKAVVAYRLYDGNRGEHIYTYNAKERDMLVAAGWKEETSDIKVLPVDAKTGVTVYRVYNPNNGGAHVFTTNPAEVKMLLDAGWEEGVAVFKTPAAGTANTLPVYRVYNTGSKNGEHQFTTSAAEKDNLVNHGWKLEGTPWYSFK